ncbi:MAG TPA: VCBS repeat-containing protein [Saprospiraceae bacterium]|nr:VCBS repeat-containing protein [Saprospiraceae bacterium]HMQ83580.1 VCBS repeat-containing protein [Saprospiraceae bacterium]
MKKRWIGVAGFIACFIWYCKSDPSAQQLPGEALSRQYCSSCHQYPEPNLLDKSTWQQYILPRMGYMMGIYDGQFHRDSLIEKGAGGERVKAANVFPAQALLSETKWQAIVSYYLENAPDSLPHLDAVAPQPLSLFKAQFPAYFLSPPSTTLVDAFEGGIYVGDAHSQSLYVFDQKLNLQQQAKLGQGIVSLMAFQEAFLVTLMGSFSPTDAPSGSLIALPTQAGLSPKIGIRDLQRPVHTAFGDLNGDQKTDLVIAEFGKWTGQLAWWSLNEQGSYDAHPLRSKSGAIRSVLQDMNGDKHLDIVALFGQGDEGIFVYYNDGQGRFSEKRLLAFPASYGSSYFDLFDFDGDALPDIIYTAGDNADYPPLVKPYHGIRIFKNEGEGQFREVLFYPYPGAYKAIPTDFDQDGDIDIAAISFFPDFAHQGPGFIYLENQGDGEFSPKTFPQAAMGRWITMDASDVDQDGDTDIVLGSLAFEVVPDGGELAKWVENGIPFVLLDNQYIH